MIANSEINENWIIFSESSLVAMSGFVKNLSPLLVFENFIVPSEKRQEDRKLCQFVKIYSYMQYKFINLILINLKVHFITFMNSIQPTTLVF